MKSGYLNRIAPNMLTEQRNQHKYFMKKAVEFTSDVIHQRGRAVEVYEFLKNWWIKHVLIWDMKYKDIL